MGLDQDLVRAEGAQEVPLLMQHSQSLQSSTMYQTITTAILSVVTAIVKSYKAIAIAGCAYACAYACDIGLVCSPEL